MTNFKDINAGKIPSKTLAEILKIDFKVLASAAFPEIPQENLKEISKLKTTGILKRMILTANILSQWDEKQVLKSGSNHPSDTVRGWCAFIIGGRKNNLKQKLADIKPFADDPHFGVREWAWMAMRNDLSLDLDKTIKFLLPWTKDKSHFIRRFSSESIRPRGVWAPHISELKDNPEIALPILEALKNDSEKYVQDSVANWLNDAAKSKAIWVKEVCLRWEKEKVPPYVLKKAQRSLK
jgi:3-methyladenine DNA glycosylase AlkC